VVKLLIVDDDISFSNQLKHALGQKHYQCFVTNTPELVIDTIKKEDISVVLLDVMMPRRSGFELCRQIRIDRDVYNTGIIFLSAMNDPEELEHGFSQGGDDYLVKPVSLSLLISRINTLISSIKNTPLLDAYTGLGTVRFLRLELQRTILLYQTSGFVYVELSGLPSLQSILSGTDTLKIINTFARHIKTIATAYFGKDYQLGHIGNGHFMVLIPPKDLWVFLKDLKKSWEDLLPEIYSNYGLSMEALKNKKESLLTLCLCGLLSHPNASTSAKSVFDSLKQLYMQSKLQPNNEILIDRRSSHSK